MQNKLYVALSLFFFSSCLYSNDLLTDYRLNGIKDIEKHMDEELAKTEYWDSYLKNTDNTFGYIESYSNVLTCDKTKSTLCLYVKNEKKTYKLKKEYAAYTGKNKGDKVKEGDLSTPIGIYNITSKIAKLDPFYGPVAFVTSYPNSYDKYKGRDGHGIWIHGLPTETKRDDFTKGCIAINNDNIECLNKNLDINQTLLIINDAEISKNISKTTLSTILAQLYAWRHAWLYNDVDTYLNFYSTDFIRFDGMSYQNFINYKHRIFQKSENKTIIFSNINVLPYPNDSDIYKISFKEYYKSNSFEFTGDKVLMIKLIENTIKIITEK